MSAAVLQSSWDEQELSTGGLPIDVWQIIISLLPFSSATKFSLVSRFWVNKTYSYLERIYLDSIKPKSEAELAQLWPKIGKECTRLRFLSCGDHVSIETLTQLQGLTQLESFEMAAGSAARRSRVAMLPHLTFLCKLQHLNLSWIRDLQSKDVIMLSKHLTSLRRVTLSGQSEITPDALGGFVSAPKLTRLGLYGCKRLQPGLFEALETSVPGLRHLSVRSISSLLPTDFLQLSRCSNLTRLSVRNTKFDDFSCAVFLQLPQLERVSLASTSVTGWGLTSLLPLKNSLKFLDAIWCNSLRSIPMLAELTNLRTLRLNTSRSIDDATRAQIEYLCNLTCLDVANCNVSPDILRTWTKLTNLCTLHLANNPLLYADDLNSLCHKLPNLIEHVTVFKNQISCIKFQAFQIHSRLLRRNTLSLPPPSPVVSLSDHSSRIFTQKSFIKLLPWIYSTTHCVTLSDRF